MRTWGVGVFDNELAQEVRADFEVALAEGLSIYAAADRIIIKYVERSSVEIYLALAELQLAHDLIQPKIKKKALTVILSGDASEPWEKTGTAVYENRLAVLQDLRRRLLATPT